MIVGIDSMILIYAGVVPSIAREPPPTPEEIEILEELGIRAKVLLHTLHRDKDTIVLPTVAIAELLVPVPPADKGALLAELDKKFWCRPLDLQAATVASDV